MDKLLKIYTYVDGVNDTPFPTADAQIEIKSFKYNANRMGAAPTITCTVMYPICLDDIWSGNVYVIFNGEKYFLKQTPTSSKDNTDVRYKHELELVSERITLDTVLFYDAVVNDTPVDDKPVTNNTKVEFSGDIREFAKRLNASLRFTKLQTEEDNGNIRGYRVLVDDDVESDTKFISLTDQYFSNVLQEVYKQYEIPYYFVGKEIHIGWANHDIENIFRYGDKDALLTISKNNANFKIVNRCTGCGSEENIPYYYPNEHPLGKVNPLYNGEIIDALQISDEKIFAKKVSLEEKITREQHVVKNVPITGMSILAQQDAWDWYTKINNGVERWHSIGSYVIGEDRYDFLLTNGKRNPWCRWWLAPTYNFEKAYSIEVTNISPPYTLKYLGKDDEKYNAIVKEMPLYKGFTDYTEKIQFSEELRTYCVRIFLSPAFEEEDKKWSHGIKITPQFFDDDGKEIPMPNDFIFAYNLKSSDNWLRHKVWGKNANTIGGESTDNNIYAGALNESIDNCVYAVIYLDYDDSWRVVPNSDNYYNYTLDEKGVSELPVTSLDFYKKKGYNSILSDYIPLIKGAKYEFTNPVCDIWAYDEKGGEAVSSWHAKRYDYAYQHMLPELYCKKEYTPQHNYIRIRALAYGSNRVANYKLGQLLQQSVFYNIRFNVEYSDDVEFIDWRNKNGAIVELSDYGLAYSGTPNIGDVVSFEQVKGSLIPFQNKLMPPVYWNTKGAESFYNAKNYPFDYTEGYVIDSNSGEYLKDGKVHNDLYIDQTNGGYHNFVNLYSDDKRKEHKEEFSEIKPSIENVKNRFGMPINMFLEFAYDDNDSDEVYEAGNYIHPYFFAKLRRFDFNLFTHANEKGEMTISMTTGNCASCNFIIGVDSDTKKNIVQVDKYGKLVRDENGNVVLGEAQEVQNDTANHEVWIALRKDIETFSNIMPNASFNYRPKSCSSADATDGDKFVITNISLPTTYIREAEKRLAEKIIEYMALNNTEKFTFSIKFSRIYLAENIDVLEKLNENARVWVEYNDKLQQLYVSSFSYSTDANQILPECSIELSDTLVQGQNALQTALGKVERTVLTSLNQQKENETTRSNNAYLSKQVQDTAAELITFEKGARFGKEFGVNENGDATLNDVKTKSVSSPTFTEGFSGGGFRMWIDDKGVSHLTIDDLTARGTFRVFELLVTKLRAVNGGLFISAANGTIKDVQLSEDGIYYDIELEKENNFLKGDYMRSQMLNGHVVANWWVEVYDIVDGKIRVLKTEFEDTEPVSGLEVVLCGSKNANRQNAIHISASEDGQPRIDILNGISTKTFDGCLRTRLGNLDGVVDEHFGDNQPHGDGLYSDNAFLKGDFILRNTGESVETKFQITEEGIKSSVSSILRDTNQSILLNGAFTDGLKGWINIYNTAEYTLLGDQILHNNGRAITTKKEDFVTVEFLGDKYVARLKNTEIIQVNSNFVNKPIIDENILVPMTFTLNAKAEEDSKILVYLGGDDISVNSAKAFMGVVNSAYIINDTLSVKLGNGKQYQFEGIEGNISKGNVVCFSEMDNIISLYNITEKSKIPYATVNEVAQSFENLPTPCVFIGLEDLSAGEDFNTYLYHSYWNGRGNLHILANGNVAIANVSLQTNDTEVRHATLFEQSEKLIKIAATNFDSEGNILESSSIVTQAEFNAMMSEKFNEDGSLKNTAGIITSTDLDALKESGDIIGSNYVDNSINELSDKVDSDIDELSKNVVSIESFAGLFAEAVDKDEDIVKQAQITAFVSKDDEGNLESGVKVSADNINLTGYNVTIESANFKVREDGSIFANNGEFSGVVRNRPSYITPDKVDEFFSIEEIIEENVTVIRYHFKQEKLSSCMIFDGTFETTSALQLKLPYLSAQDFVNTKSYTKEEVENARSFIGVEITIYNNTNKNIAITAGRGSTVDQDKLLYPNEYISYKCILGGHYLSSWIDSGLPTENIYWEIQHYNSQSKLIVGI